ncbi:MAG: DUF1552 domain-containing protein [Myxococcota bacterium]
MSGNRRWFLRGAAGATLAIPVLPSLLRSSRAEAQARTPLKYFVNFGTNHGAAWPQNMYPTIAAPSMESMSYGGHTIQRAPLVGAADASGNVALSPVLTAPATTLTPALVQKMLVLRGLDIPFYIAHHTGGHLGNFAANAADPTSSEDGAIAKQQAARPTIDQVMAWSSAFYPDLSGVTQRSMVMTPRVSYGFENPSTRSGNVQEVGTIADSPAQLYHALFPAPPSMRTPIVDRVLENYRRVRGSARISAADKTRLDDHMQRVSELQRRLATMVTCMRPPAPAAPHANAQLGAVIWNPPYAQNAALQEAWFQIMNDLIVAAFSCGLSRIATAVIDPTFEDSVPYQDWHQGVAHRAMEADGARQGILWGSYKTFFNAIFLDLVKKLDAVPMPDGTTLLDQSLVAWTQESGIVTHYLRDAPVVAFGGAAGFLKTGQIVDYRNQSLSFDPADTLFLRNPGLLWQQWLGTVLQAMGIPKTEWEKPDVNAGYPDFKFSHVQWERITEVQAYPESVWTVAGDVLPYLRA